MAIVSDIEIRLMANIARLQQDMNAARGAVNSSLTSINRSIETAKSAFASLAGVVSVGMFVNFIKGAIDSIDALNDLSARTSISIKDLSGLAYAAKLSDSSLDGIAGSITKLAQNIGKDEDKFRRLGVTATEPLEAFKQLSDIFNAIQDPQQKAAFGAEALGKSWQESAVLLGEGSAGIDALIKKGQELAGVTDGVAKQAGMFNDKLDELGIMAQGAGQRIAADLLPMLNMLVDDLRGAGKGATDLDEDFSPVKETFRALVILGGNVAFVLKAVGTEVGVLAAQIGEYYGALFKLLSLDPKGAWQQLKGAFGKGGIGDMAKEDAEKAREAFDQWEQRWADVGTARQKAVQDAAEPFPDPFGIDAKFQEQAAARAAAFLKDSDNQAKAKKAGDDAAAAAKKNAESYRGLIDAIQMKILESDREAKGLDKLTDSQKLAQMLNDLLREGKLSLTATEEGYYRALIETLGANEATVKANAKAKAAAEQTQKAVDDLTESRRADLADAVKQAETNENLVATFGKTKSAIEALEVARLQERLSQRAALDLSEEEVTQLNALIEAKKRSAGATAQLEGLEEARKAGEELKKFFDDSKAETFGDTLAKAFGRAGSAMGQLSTTFQSYAAKQVAFEKQRGNAAVRYLNNLDDEKQYAKNLQKIDQERFSSQLGGYGDMAGAAAGFFGEQSKGYKILSGVSQAFHAAELAANIAELVPKGISAILTQGQGDPYTALPRMAAMAAFVAALGVAVGGGAGGSVSVSKQRQAANGTGSVLGDSSAKSESLAKALAMVEDNTYRNLSVNYDMLAALRNIESSLSGLGNLIVRGTGISDLASSVGSGASGGFWGGIVSSIFGGKTSVLDTGIKIDPTSLAAAMAGGINAQSYIDTKKSGGWFSSSKYRTQTEALGAEVNDQFSKVVMSLADGVKAAASVIGVSGEQFNARLASFVVDIGLISLKDLKGEEVQQALEDAFSKLGDDIANYAVQGLSEFQKVGEGTYETLVRISNDYATVEAVLSSFGKSFGAVGLASVAARENLIDLAGGLDEFTSQGSFFLENFFSDAEKEATLRTAVYAQLDKVSGGSAAQTTAQFKALVLAQDLTTQAGRDAYASLMSVSQAFIDLSKFADAAADAAKEAAENAVQLLRDTANNAFEALQRSIDARKEELKNSFDAVMQGLQESIDATSSKVSALQSLASALRGADAGGTGITRMQAQAQLAAAAAIAKAGGALPTADSLKDALAAISQDSSDMYSSFVDYQRDRLLASNSVEELAGITDTQLSVAQRTLLTLQDQKAAAQAAYTAEVARLDGILTAAQQQIDAINGVNTSVLSLSTALMEFASSISAALGNNTIAGSPTASGAASIEGLYNSLLGRGSDTSGLSFYMNQLAAGVSLDWIRQEFMNSTEYMNRIGANVYTPQSSGTMSAEGSAMVEELRNVSTRLANIETHTGNTASSSAQTASVLDDATEGGNAMRVTT